VLKHHPDDVREALDVPLHIPVVVTDARHKAAVRDSLVNLVKHAMTVGVSTSV
jgi:signal recognition particle receptor subunit beta